MRSSKMSKETAKVTTVTMSDGRVVDFPGKRKLQKSAIVDNDGFIILTLDFVNGQTRTFPIQPKDFTQYAVHGALQKTGDEIAGVDDIDDCVEAVDDLLSRLAKGEWTVKREAGAFNGASILAKALVEYSGKTIEQIKTYLSNKSVAEKNALRKTPELAEIITRLEEERAAKQPKLDTGILFAEIDDLAN